jgi:hypothetical protein
MAIQLGIGLSKGKNPVLAAKEATKVALADMRNVKIDLAIVFSSADLSCEALLKAIRDALGEYIPVIGCSGLAIIFNQNIYRHGLIVLLLSLPQGIFCNTACTKEISARTALIAGEELGQQLLLGFKDIHRTLAVLFCDGMIQDNPNLIYGLQERLGRSFPLVGASVSDNLIFKKTYLYFNQDVFSDGACGMLFGGRLNFGLGIKHGWRPLGKPHYVTKCSNNVVYEIDNKPAVKMYEEYLAFGITELRKKLKFISTLYPLGLYLPGEEEYLLRNIRFIESDGSLVLQGNIPKDSLIRLMIGTKESCLAATKQAVEEVKMSSAKNFVLVFNSVSRYILLRKEAPLELEIIKSGFGEDVPVIGLYTYGEQAPLRAISYYGQTYFHNQTVAILAIGA